MTVAAQEDHRSRIVRARPVAGPGAAIGLVGLATIAVLFLQNPALFHWFVVPVVLCGVVCGMDALEWMSGRRDVFDPVGLVGILGLHFFFLTPLLHVRFDFWIDRVVHPVDWRPWLGAMALLNLLGLLVYRFSRRQAMRWFRANRGQIAARQLAPKTFVPLALGTLVVAALLQYWVYRHFGGFWGYVSAYEEQIEAFRNMGWIFTLSESFPILAFLAWVVYARGRERAVPWSTIAFALVVFLCLRLAFGGFRGSRANTVWSLFWAAGAVHFLVRPVPRKVVLVGLVFMFVFLYGYGFYKTMGRDALHVFESEQSRWLAEDRTGRTIESTLLHDLGRADIQAFLLHQIATEDSDYSLAFGRTYVGTMALLIPRRVWPDRPPTKVREGTDALYGRGAYEGGGLMGFPSTRVYGLAGETLLNFGPIAVPLAFGLLGILVALVGSIISRLPPADPRWLLTPFIVSLPLFVLVMDSDNTLFYIIKYGAVPTLVIFIGSRRDYSSSRSSSGEAMPDGEPSPGSFDTSAEDSGAAAPSTGHRRSSTGIRLVE